MIKGNYDDFIWGFGILWCSESVEECGRGVVLWMRGLKCF